MLYDIFPGLYKGEDSLRWSVFRSIAPRGCRRALSILMRRVLYRAILLVYTYTSITPWSFVYMLNITGFIRFTKLPKLTGMERNRRIKGP